MFRSWPVYLVILTSTNHPLPAILSLYTVGVCGAPQRLQTMVRWAQHWHRSHHERHQSFAKAIRTMEELRWAQRDPGFAAEDAQAKHSATAVNQPVCCIAVVLSDRTASVSRLSTFTVCEMCMLYHVVDCTPITCWTHCYIGIVYYVIVNCACEHR